MQKKLKSLLIAASLMVAATLIFVACGDGDIKDIVESEWENAKGHGDVILNSVLGNLPSNTEEPLSSNGEFPQYSSAEIPQSSATQQPQSSATQQPQSSNGGSPTSSATELPKSSSASAPKSSAAAASGCKESNPKSGFTCSWNQKDPLLPGTALSPVGTAPSGCQLSWKYLDDDSPAAVERACKAVSGDITAEGSKTYLLFAALSCADGNYTNACGKLSSKAAPYLTGTCAWSKNPTTAARGATPGGVSVVDGEKVCTSPTVVYKYSGGSKTWPTNGIVDAGTYADVQAVLNCPAYAETVTKDCPSLAVNGGSLVSVTIPNFNDQTTTAQKQFKIPSDECADIEVTWTSNWNDHPIAVFCTANFDHSETGGVATAGKLELQYNGVIKSATGAYNVTLQNNGFNLQPKPTTTDKTYEFLGICATAYVNGTKIKKDIDCEITTNEQGSSSSQQR